MSPPVWLHCGDCDIRVREKWFLHVREDCLQRLSTSAQRQPLPGLQGPLLQDSGTHPQVTTDVQEPLSDPSDLIKPHRKDARFPREKQNGVSGGTDTKRLAALDVKHKEFLKQKEEERITAIEMAKMRLAQLLRDIVAEKKEHHRHR